MKILLLAAMKKEIDLLLNLMDSPKESEIGGCTFFKGEIDKNEVFIAPCGIGKVNSAVNALRLIMALSPDLVINSGVAGGAGIPVASILVAEKVAYHDVWCGPSTNYGQADNCPLFFKSDSRILDITRNISDNANIVHGLICSGDKFISTPGEIAEIRSHFPDVKAVDMESASIAQVCFFNNIPFAVIRVVSDTPGEGENISQYKDFWSKAPEKTFGILKTILEKL